MISYLSRRKKPIRFVFFLWIILLVAVGFRFYYLFTGQGSVDQYFALQVLELAIACCMLSHLAFNEAGRYLKFIIPAGIVFTALFILFPDRVLVILGFAQLSAYILLVYLGSRLYLNKKPYFRLLISIPIIFVGALTLFGIGPFSLGVYFPISAKILNLAAYLLSMILHATYLNRMAALTSKKFVENEFITRKLKEVDQLKTNFFSSITHEFRTPLTLIQGPIDELLERTKDAESKQLLMLVKSNSNRLLKLINQLLDLARLDAQQMKLHLNDVNLQEFFSSLFSQFSAMANTRKLHFTWTIPETIPTAYVDDEKLEAILSNLIANALKFTPENGRVNVSVNLTDSNLSFDVTDTGRGISARKLEHIFDRFYQVEPSDSSHAEGTGIGLALVKEYTELMNGLIRVESEVNTGTRFFIEIPVLLSEQQVQPVQPYLENTLVSVTPEEIHDEAENPLILVTDDNEQIRSFIKNCLGKNYRYSEARHGRDALALAIDQVPDLIVSDLMMPEMDGIEFCRLVKRDKRTDHIPFIMLTAKAGEENKLQGLLTGTDEYLIKPFRKAELVAKVNNLIALRRNLQSHIKRSLLTQATPVQATSAEEEFIIKAKTYVEHHLNKQLTVESLADELNLSREQCYRKLVALTSLSPSAFIRKLRLQKAAQLIAAKWGSVSQVAYEVGFENLSHFSKTFKEEFGSLPSEYEG